MTCSVLYSSSTLVQWAIVEGRGHRPDPMMLCSRNSKLAQGRQGGGVLVVGREGK